MKNKKSKIVNLLKLGVYLLVFSLLLWNCEKDDDLTLNAHQTEKSKIQKQVVSIGEIPEIQEYIGNKKIYNTKLHSRGDFETTAIGIIDKSKIIKLVNSLNQTTYTFRILKADTEEGEHLYFDNLVLKQTEDSYVPYILRYHLKSASDYQNIYNNIQEIEYIEVDKNDFGFNLDELLKRELCRTTIVKDCGMSLHHEALGDPCESEVLYVTVSVVCSGGSDPYTGTGGGEPYTPGPEPDLSDQGSGGGGTSTPITMLEAEDLYRINALDGQLNLNIKERSFLEKNAQIAKEAFDFCYLNQWDTEAKSFAEKLIKIYLGEIVDDIIDETENPCVGNIIKELQKKDSYGALVPDLEGKSHLSQMVLDLFGECKNYDVTINVAELGVNSQGFLINAHTDGIEGITLDNDLINDATQLSIAKTLIHESLHLFINFKTRQDREPSLVVLLNNYYQEYRKDYPDDVANNLTQHKFMAEFIEALAYSLSAYDNHQQDMSYYKAMSWGGLESSETYQGLTEDEQKQIQEVIKNERYAKSDAKSTKCE